MEKTKKILAVISIFLIITASLPLITAEKQFNPSDDAEEINLVRYSPDGKKSIIKINIQKDISDEQLLQTIKKIFEQDTEIQKYIQDIKKQSLDNDQNNDTRKFCLIFSRGRGFHFRFPIPVPPMILTKIKIAKKILKLPFIQIWHMLVLWKLSRSIKPSLFIYCRYPFDSKAKTIVSPLIPGNNITYNGPHQVTSKGFIGYTTWHLPRARLGRILRHIHVGISYNTTLKEFKTFL